MDDVIDRFGAERVWVATVASLAAAVVLGALLFPQRVYVEIIWQCFGARSSPTPTAGTAQR